MIKIFNCTLLLCLISALSLGAQGVVSQLSDANGNFASFGTSTLLSSTKLNVGASHIRTSGTLFPPPTLRINDNSANVTIGATDGKTAKLTIRAHDESQTDLRIEGHGLVSTQGSFYFQVDDNNNANEYFVIESGGSGEDLFWIGENGYNFMRGNLAIGDPITNKHASGFRLSVDGKIISEEVRVELDANWPDYVFMPDYKLMPLESLQEEIAALGHLPGIPSAATVESEGFELGEMNRLLLEKVEELTLYVMSLNNRIKQLENEK